MGSFVIDILLTRRFALFPIPSKLRLKRVRKNKTYYLFVKSSYLGGDFRKLQPAIGTGLQPILNLYQLGRQLSQQFIIAA